MPMMAPRTRSTNSSPKKTSSLPPTSSDEAKHSPVSILIAPRQISADARILSLPHPTTGLPKRFIFDPENGGLFELKKTAALANDPRSVILAPLEVENANPQESSRQTGDTFSGGFVNKNAEMLTATPFNLAFVLLRAVGPQTVASKKNLFQPLEDLLETPELENESMRFVLARGRSVIEAAMTAICDTVDAGDEQMFRYSEDKLFALVLEKAQRVADCGLPASLEDHYVTRVLEAPMLNVRREETAVVAEPIRPTTPEETGSQDESLGSQSNTDSNAVSAVFSEVSVVTSVSTIEQDNIPTEVKRLQRIRVAYNFIAASYLPPTVSARLATLLSESSSVINFEPLDEYLKRLAQLQAEAAASRCITDFSRKRNLADDEMAEERLEKKRRQEEEEKRKKANESRGVRDLKKVNVSGMKKMSDFFAKKPTVAVMKT